MVLHFIPRYINKKNEKTITLQDLGWSINIGKEKKHIVTYCNNCKQQRCFKIVSEKKTISNKTGKEYIKGYYGYCTFCKENRGELNTDNN